MTTTMEAPKENKLKGVWDNGKLDTMAIVQRPTGENFLLGASEEG